MVNHCGGDAGLCSPLQAAGIRPVTDDGTNLNRQPVIGNGIDNGLQIAALSGYQDDDGEWRGCRVHGRLVACVDNPGFTGSLFDVANDAGIFTQAGKMVECRLCLVGSYTNDHANAAIEGAVHLRGLDIAGALQPVKYRGWLPCTCIDYGTGIVREYPWQVFGQAASGNVGECMNADLAEQGQYRFDIYLCRSEQPLRQWSASKVITQLAATDFDNFANQ